MLDGLKIGNTALKKVHDVLTIDEVERILDETKEGVEKQQVSLLIDFFKFFKHSKKNSFFFRKLMLYLLES